GLLASWIVLVEVLSPAGADTGSATRLTETTQRSLIAVHALIDEGRYADAAERLEGLRRRTRQRPHDQAIVLQTLGHVHHAMDNDDAAIASFSQALELSALPEDTEGQTRYNLAALLVGQGRYREALRAIEPGLHDGSVEIAEAYFLAAVARYRLAECEAAVPHVERALDRSGDPPRAWQDLLVACLLERERYVRALPVLRDLVARYPGDAVYWRQLAFAYQQSNREEEAIAVLALAQRRGLLDAQAMRRLAGLYLHGGMPWRAVTLLEGAIARGGIARTAGNWTLLADSLLAAGEADRAVIPLRHAAERGDEAGSWHRLGSVLFSLGRWEASVEALERAVAATGPGETGNAHLMLGVAAIRAGDPDRAQVALRRALDATEAGGLAGQWLEWLARQPPSGGIALNPVF
ncbi:MAG: tetratricopeptide repeat protein, partial [Pseudomonadota bacterium]|nr:tetratricopeptide repeat protein [Pseudomonadota bacterium]